MEAAVNAVDRDKKIAEQPAVDAMAEAIEHAIADLQYKDADYTKVDAAIAKANALKKNDYKDFSAVEGAVNAVAVARTLPSRPKWMLWRKLSKMPSQRWSKSLPPVAVLLPAVPLPRTIP